MKEQLSQKHAVITVETNPDWEAEEYIEEPATKATPEIKEQYNIHVGKFAPSIKKSADRLIDAIRDTKLKQSIHDQKERCEKWLTEKKFGNKQKDTIAENDLKDFRSSPYEWMRTDLRKRINEGEILLKQPNEEKEKEGIRQTKLKNEGSLRNLNEAYQRKIPLKLEREFTPSEINLEDGRLFKIGQYTNELNQYLKEQNKDYKIIGVVERGNEHFIVFRTNEGKRVGVSMGACQKMLRQERQRDEDQNNKEKAA